MAAALLPRWAWRPRCSVSWSWLLPPRPAPCLLRTWPSFPSSSSSSRLCLLYCHPEDRAAPGEVWGAAMPAPGVPATGTANRATTRHQRGRQAAWGPPPHSFSHLVHFVDHTSRALSPTLLGPASPLRLHGYAWPSPPPPSPDNDHHLLRLCLPWALPGAGVGVPSPPPRQSCSLLRP